MGSLRSRGARQSANHGVRCFLLLDLLAIVTLLLPLLLLLVLVIVYQFVLIGHFDVWTWRAGEREVERGAPEENERMGERRGEVRKIDKGCLFGLCGA